MGHYRVVKALPARGAGDVAATDVVIPDVSKREGAADAGRKISDSS